MPMPWSISGDVIAAWADRIEAADELHALVRRLLLATVPMAELSLRTAGGVRLSGPDALVVPRARGGGPYCPDGASLWEMSVDRQVGEKLKNDYAKEPPAGLNPRTTTYVAVTARRRSTKEAWLQARRAEGRWADVRLLDADDLAGWLEMAPAVAFWFAETKLQQPLQDMRTVDELLREFSNRTRPPLPPAVVLAGKLRGRAAEDLLRALARHDDALLRMSNREREANPLPPLVIGAETVEEALVFIAAALAQPDNQEAESLKARAVIVDSLEAFRFCLRSQSNEPLVILPRFEGVPRAQAAGQRVHLVLPTLASNLRPDEGIALGVIPFKPLARALDEAGVNETERLARESDGRIAKLQRLLGHVNLPPWAQGGSAGDLLALLLAGAWTPSRERDREILRRLGADPDEAERLCVRLSQSEDPPLEAERDHGRVLVFRWVSPRDAFRQLGKNLTEAHLRSFYEVALSVLSPPPPTADEASADLNVQVRLRMAREQAACSGELFKGIASSIAWLSVEDRALAPYLTGQGSGLAEGLVRRLLVPEAWAWSFLSGVLQDLAEAAPRVFLDQLGEGLDRGKEGIAPSHQLLWALETLAWDRDLLFRVTEALARLVPHDNLPANHMHRPINSLREVLHFGLPQSQSTAEDRINALRNLFGKYDEIAWKVSVDLFQGLRMPQLISPAPRPQYRSSASLPPEGRGVSQRERYEQAEAMVTLMLERAGDKPDRWASLVSLSLALGDLGPRVLDGLEAAEDRIEDTEAKIWNALRNQLGLFLNDQDDDGEGQETPGEENKLTKTLRTRLESLYENTFRPKDVALEYAWLFDFQPRLPKPVAGGWEAAEAYRQKLQREAVEALRDRPDRGGILGRLATRATAPQFLANALAQASWAEEIESMLLADPPTANLGPVEPLFVASRNHVCGWDWAARFIETIVRRNQMDRAIEILLPFIGSRPWNLVDKIGDPLRANYWSKVSPWYGPLSAEEWERGIACLLDAGRPAAALRTADRAVDQNLITSPTIVRVLEATAAEDANTREQLLSDAIVPRETEIEQMFLALDRDPGVEPEFVAKLEILHAESLTSVSLPEETRRGARRFYEKISASSAHFMDVLRRLVRPKDQRGPDAWFREPTDPAGIERKHLNTLLFGWPGYPGEGLPLAEREAFLERWCGEVLQRAEVEDIRSLAVHTVAHILSRVEPHEGGHWPCLTARRLIDGGHPDLARDLSVAKYNNRGWTARSSKLETEIAQRYQAGAEALRATYPNTAAMLEEMAADHRRRADTIEPEERRRDIEYGEDEPRSRRSPPPSTEQPGGPLERLEITGVGPADKMRLDFAPRLNIFVGDNSAGKTFVLDVLWWTFSGKWPTNQAWVRPDSRRAGTPSISVTAGSRSTKSEYDALNTAWPLVQHALAPGLVVYERVDGGFSVWDPLRGPNGHGTTYHFTQDELWKRLTVGGVDLCNGLIADVYDWCTRRNDEYRLLLDMLAILSPPGEIMALGEAVKLPEGGDRWYPTLKLSYGEVPILYASAAVKRVLSLAYLLIWAFQGHREAAKEKGRPMSASLTLLVDEVEAHLHPKWQRRIMPALLEAVERISQSLPVQVFVSTHASLILASLEPHFDREKDALLHFALERGAVTVRPILWTMHGDATSWLLSNAFGLPQARSIEAQRAIEAAFAYLRGEMDPHLDTVEKIDAELRRTLPDNDSFLLDWFLERGRA